MSLLPRVLAAAAILVSFLLLPRCAGGPPESSRLIVYVVVDQLRADLLERYDTLFSGGFRRLHDEGFRFLEATHEHAKTATAVGHATLSTGVYPSRSGIVGNSWLERVAGGWRSVYSVEDTLSHILGLPNMEGRSPRNLLRGGLADWVMKADSGAIVVSVSRKDRAAVTMSGKAKGHTYWIAEDEGRFVTSSYYADRYPDWVERINQEEMPRIFGDSIWEQTITEAHRDASRPDTATYEADGVHTHFPHRFYQEASDPDHRAALNRWAYGLTYPDAAVGAFAMEAVESLGMGKDEQLDYLALAFSQTDAVGHDFGPLSREQLQNLLHLDEVLGQLMTFLDAEVGEGRWVMGLTGDHGVLNIPEYLQETGSLGRRATREELSQLREVFQRHRGLEGVPQDLADSLIASLESLPFVEDAMSVAELTTPPPPDSFAVLARNSYHPDRWIGGFGSEGTGVLFRFPEAYYPDPSPHGTGHGSPYYYDRHVPLIFLGPGVSPGVSNRPVKTVDVAPTLAELAGIPAPPDLDGVPLVK